VAAVFVGLKIPALRPAISDENIYFYMAWRMAHGAVPYRDFFYANPPGLLVPGAVLSLVFGPSFYVLKSLPMLAALGAVLFTYVIIAKRAGPATGVLCVLAWMGAETFIRASSHWTGINVTTFLIVLAIFLVLRGRGGWAGLVIAFAGLTKTYGLVAVPALWLGAFLQGPKVHRRFLLGFFPLTIGANLLLLIVGGEEFVRQAIRYHMAKPPDPDANIEAVRDVFVTSAPWMAASVIGIVIVAPLVFRSFLETVRRFLPGRAGDRPQVDPLLPLCAVFILSFAGFMVLQKRVFEFYLLPLFPVFAILLGEANRRLDSALERVRRYFLPVLRGVPAAVWLVIPIVMSWPTIRDYFSHEIDYGFPEAFPIAEYVRETTQPNETLFGYSAAAPLVAFLAERRLAHDEADTNAMRFRSGIDDVGKVFREAEADHLRYLFTIIRKDRYHVGIFRIAEFQNMIRGRYRTAKTWPSNKGTYVLLEKQPG